MKPELWSDEDIDTFATTVYEECKEKDCDKCLRRLEVNDETCMVDVIRELWRKWKNTQAEVEAAVADIERRCYNCKHWNTELNNCPCSECYLEASAYYSHAKWEWRGVQEEKNE